MGTGVAQARSVLVTGSSSGIGAAIAQRLAGEGWQVTGVDRVPASSTGGVFVAQHVTDLADPAQVKELLGKLRPTQALVHAAGLLKTGVLGQLDADAGERMWTVHVRALQLLANACAPAMTQGGRIVAIGSRTSSGAAGRSQYAATKAAITAMIRSWALELAPRGVTANVVAPAATATPMLQSPGRTVAPQLPPIGRYIEPREIAAYVAFLLSPEAAAITGQELFICGGASL